jgi:hypothetical protein
VSCTSIKDRPISTASALPPCHRTCAVAPLQAVQSATLPQLAKGATFPRSSPSLPRPTPLAACAPPRVVNDQSSPALHTGFIRATAELDDTGAPTNFQEVSILVDSGSQQAPLCSTAVAERLGTTGKLSSFALQAGGQPLPIYDVGWCDLGINGRPCRTYFKSAALSQFDIILGES